MNTKKSLWVRMLTLLLAFAMLIPFVPSAAFAQSAGADVKER